MGREVEEELRHEARRSGEAPTKVGHWRHARVPHPSERAPVSRLRVQFVHGLEGSPQGAKARLLAEHFDARTPAMDTTDFEGCVARQAEELIAFRPDVLVGSSFGGAVAVALLARGLRQGPTLLLAQAALRYDPDAQLPEGVPIWLVHGLRDDIVDPQDSRRLARTGSADLVRLIEVDDDHSLHESVSSGALLDWVRAIALAGAGNRGDGGESPSPPAACRRPG
jgi:predicted esterase